MESQGCMDWYITLTLVRDFGSHATSFTLMIVDSEDQEAWANHPSWLAVLPTIAICVSDVATEQINHCKRTSQIGIHDVVTHLVQNPISSSQTAWLHYTSACDETAWCNSAEVSAPSTPTGRRSSSFSTVGLGCLNKSKRKPEAVEGALALNCRKNIYVLRFDVNNQWVGFRFWYWMWL